MPTKWAIVFMLILLIAAGLAPFVVPIDNGRPLLDWRSIKAPTIKAPDILRDVEVPSLPGSLVSQSSVTVVYQWQGDDGEVHLADIPPPSQVFHILEYDSEQNIILGLPATDPQTADVTQQESGLQGVYSPAQIEKLYRDAEQRVEKSKERQRLLDEQITTQ